MASLHSHGLFGAAPDPARVALHLHFAAAGRAGVAGGGSGTKGSNSGSSSSGSGGAPLAGLLLGGGTHPSAVIDPDPAVESAAAAAEKEAVLEGVLGANLALGFRHARGFSAERTCEVAYRHMLPPAAAAVAQLEADFGLPSYAHTVGRDRLGDDVMESLSASAAVRGGSGGEGSGRGQRRGNSGGGGGGGWLDIY